ncbi:hypothetical protein IFM89_012615 [Coptis chinensis]|uniref:RPW8 domain-containing protein n=1 Tax=Coptis chinensis TaxID=261450 RepID=A0A835M5I1_9MAGN|nr:hypothetical protein IFM89_012615 [Coptis chinensis]
MAVTDFFVGELATELLKQLILVGKRHSLCKPSAQQLIATIKELQPIIEEIKYTGVELPQTRQRQLDDFSRTLVSASELADKVLHSSKWNVYKNLRFARKMENIQKSLAQFLNGPIQAHILADVHHVRVGIDQLSEKICDMRIEARTDGWLGEAMERRQVEAVNEVVMMEVETGGSLVSLVGSGMVLAKKKVKEMIIVREDLKVVGICGIGGTGKTTLATEISRDPEIRREFKNRVFFITVSQSPDVEQLKQSLRVQMTGNSMVPPPWMAQSDWLIREKTLVILDDVWSLSVLEQLVFHFPGCKTLAVSRFKFPVFNYTYELDLLRDDEAISLFCYYAFGQKSIPLLADKKLVEQVVKECKGLPLALKVIGASLRDQPQMFWISARNRLSRGESICESHETNLLDRMAVSIAYLQEKVRECFLDLASFPEDKKIPLDVLINMWVEIHDLDEEEAFAILIELSDKNLINLVKDARAGDKYSSYFEICVTEHDVLRDMALHLSNRGSLTERRRLLMPRREEVLPKEWKRNMEKSFQAQIVSIHTGEMKEGDWLPMDFPKAEVLILNFSSSEYYLPSFINRMPKLRALVLINYGNSSTVLHNLSVFASMTNLRSLWFEKVIVPSILPTTVPLHNLHKISLVLCEFSNSLHGSMLDIPPILPRLLELTIDHCINLTALPSSICKINSLKSLSITNCHDLHELPADLGKLNSLQILRFCACPALAQLPQSISGLEKLNYLDISQCLKLRCLPEEMGGLIRLEKLDMRECSQVRNLPRSVAKLRWLNRVICDEEAAWLWREYENLMPELCIEVAEECFNLDWLVE